MTNEEQRVLVTAEKEKPDLGSKPIDLNGDVLEFVGADEGPIILSPKDEDLILPLEKSAKRSRQEMIEQARETAFQHLGLPRTEDNQGRKPPSWWINYENGEGLKSNQILVYAPHLEPTQIVKMPQMFQNMYSRGQFRPGWHLLEVTKEPPRAIIFDGKLT